MAKVDVKHQSIIHRIPRCSKNTAKVGVKHQSINHS